MMLLSILYSIWSLAFMIRLLIPNVYDELFVFMQVQIITDVNNSSQSFREPHEKVSHLVSPLQSPVGIHTMISVPLLSQLPIL
ncbi:hypothetical protein VNO77_00187 [Canavalia gladiata]|uniref:Uncharacterized protein n=1 Tax=Canavalia gladiata TaxID=3824 RepID=A0AAN9MPL3_CANGL